MRYTTRTKNFRSIGILSIIAMTGVATFLSMSADMTGSELGALFNLFLPGFFGLVALIVFLITCMLTDRYGIRIFVLIIFCLYLLYVGLSFKFNTDFLPFPLN